MTGEKGHSGKHLQRGFSDGYVWMDWVSIPQCDHSLQTAAISCITQYVGMASAFVILAGFWKHVDDGTVRDVRAWKSRGWCGICNQHTLRL